jgi:uncharacterized protein
MFVDFLSFTKIFYTLATQLTIMTSLETPIASPCIRNCCLDEDEICLGCFRSLLEVVAWADADNIARQEILNNTKTRRVAYHERYPRSIR